MDADGGFTQVEQLEPVTKDASNIMITIPQVIYFSNSLYIHVAFTILVS